MRTGKEISENKHRRNKKYCRFSDQAWRLIAKKVLTGAVGWRDNKVLLIPKQMCACVCVGGG